MSAAASQLGMTQSAVSQAMKRAEAQVDVTLVHRDRRPLVPTEAGRVLVAHIREIALRAERAIEEVRATALRPERQDLRIGMVDTFASSVGPVLIRDLMEGSIALRVTAFSRIDPGAHRRADAARNRRGHYLGPHGGTGRADALPALPRALRAGGAGGVGRYFAQPPAPGCSVRTPSYSLQRSLTYGKPGRKALAADENRAPRTSSPSTPQTPCSRWWLAASAWRSRRRFA